MPLYISVSKSARYFLILLCLSLGWAHASSAQGFDIRQVQTQLVDRVYVLNAEIDYQFSKPALEALENGVPLIILVDIEVERVRQWWLNKDIAELQQGYLLLYHALTEKYIVNNLNSGVQENYDTLSGALGALGNIEMLPILDAKLAENDGDNYVVHVHTYLDLESLPAPMRPIAYISTHWRLESEWSQWPLEQ